MSGIFRLSYSKLMGTVLLQLILFITVDAQQTAVAFLPHWLPQAQFAGYYAAKKMGFYRAEGLDVKILTGGPGAPVYDALLSNEAQIVSGFLSGAVEARDAGIPLVNVAQITQRSALAFVMRKGSGIERPVDMNGKRIGIWRSGFQELPRTFLKIHQVEPARIVPINATISLFLKGGIDVLTVMWYNEFHQLYAAGIDTSELNVFFFADYGLDVPEDGLYCTSQYLAQNKEVVNKFVRATLKGWDWAFKNQENALDLVIEQMKQAHVPYNRAHQRWMLNRMKDLMYKNSVLCPPLTREVYQFVNNLLFEQGQIKSLHPFSEFCPMSNSL